MAVALGSAPTSAGGVGPLLAAWRRRRRLSQLDLATRAEVSTRHLSFVETGRARPSRELLLHLAEHLDVPLRERNALLLAAGFAPGYGERPLDAPELDLVRAAVEQVLAAHEPLPALAVDRRHQLVAANAGVALLVAGVAPHLLEPPANVMRIALHPDGLAPRLRNLPEVAANLLARLDREVAATGDVALAELRDELGRYPGAVGAPAVDVAGRSRVVVPMVVAADGGDLSFFSTITTFGTAVDVTVSELSVEAFYPADRATALVLGLRRSTGGGAEG